MIFIIYFALKNLTDYIGQHDVKLMMIVGIFTIIPTMTWARVYLTSVLEKAEK